MLLRGLPSIDHFELMPKKYFRLLCSTSLFEMKGPVYSTIRLFLGIGFVANNPKPVAVRLTA